MRSQRTEVARPVARVVAQLRPRPAVRHPAGDRPSCVRPRHHPFRSGQQLRPAVWLGGGQLRSDAGDGPFAVPRRAGDLDQGWLRHVAGALRRLGVAEVPAGVARPVARPDGPRLRRHLLFAPGGSGHAAGGDDGGARHGRAIRPRPLRRHLVVQLGPDAGSGDDPRRTRHSATDPSAVVLDDQPMDRGRPPARHHRGGRRGLHRLLAACPGAPHGPLSRRRAGRLSDRDRRGDEPRHVDRGPPQPRQGSQRGGRSARPDTRPTGAGLGVARPTDDLAGDRGEQRCPARGQR